MRNAVRLILQNTGRGREVVTWPELKMSATEEDTELRDLLIQNLENNGVLNKIKVNLIFVVYKYISLSRSVVFRIEPSM